MRIPSQFTDDSLYRGGKRPTSASGPSYRRLFRLFVALVLVVLVMKEAARPQLYETFFGAPSDAKDPAELGLDGLGSVASDGRADDAPPADDHPALDESLAASLMSRVVDGSVWRSEDVDAVYFLLANAHEADASGATTVAVLPLLQQPEVYRGRPVRFRGKVMKAESVTAAENGFGVTEYWQLWLRPSDGGDRPLVAVVPDVPEQIAVMKAGDKPIEVNVVGRFLKRLAYRSSIGADLAPVIVGSLAVVDPGVEVSPATKAENEIPRARLIAGIVMACLVGLALAGVTMWRTAVSARHARTLRHSSTTRSETFLKQLSDTEDDGSIHS